MKKSMKIVSTLMIALMIIMVATPVFATSVTVTPVAPTETSGILNLAGKILGFLQWIALIGGVLIIAVLGIKSNYWNNQSCRYSNCSNNTNNNRN